MKTLFRSLSQDLRVDSFYVGRLKLIKVFLCSVGFRATVIYRLSHFLYLKKRLSAAYYLQRRNINKYGIDIAPAASLGEGLRLLHTSGIVIGAGVVVGRNCTILHGVTLGVKNVSQPANENDFPEIGSNVTLAANVSIFGKVIIRDNEFLPAHTIRIENAQEKSALIKNIGNQ